MKKLLKRIIHRILLFFTYTTFIEKPSGSDDSIQINKAIQDSINDRKWYQFKSRIFLYPGTYQIGEPIGNNVNLVGDGIEKTIIKK